MILAHRFSYELHYGKFDKSLCVLHKCDNPPCVAPDHLFLGTKADNNKDRDRKNRCYGQKGEENCFHKLTEVQVIEIKLLIKNNINLKNREIGEMFNVSRVTIDDIRIGKTWRHIK